jgi:hypothetical protein
MLFNTVATLASLAFVSVDAAPAIAVRAVPGYVKDCIDVKISGAWVIGSCLADDGKTRVQSSVWLATKITNKEGNLGVRIYANSYTAQADRTYSGWLLEDTGLLAMTARSLVAPR